MTNRIKTSYQNELRFEETVKLGSKGPSVVRVQEWLNLWRYVDAQWYATLSLDGDFGPATQRTVIRFQNRHGLTPDGIVGRHTYYKLCEPMRKAYEEIHVYNPSLSDLIVLYAHQHLSNNPKELLNKNLGPWVRAYMDGLQGEQWYWCMGFAQSIYDLAFASLGRTFTSAMKRSFSCDVVGNDAIQNNRLIKNADIPTRLVDIQAGDLFLILNKPGDWTHTGIIINIDDEIMETIEGNTNDEGSRNGYEVCQRFRNHRTHKIDVVQVR